MTFLPPTLSTSIAANIERLEQAIAVPPPKGDANRSVQKSGVLAADGRFVENSVTWRNGSQVNLEPEFPAEADIQEMAGRYMFAGPLFGHFGHFLVESICRFWAVDHLKDKIDGVVFVPKFQNRPQHVINVYRPLMEMLGLDLPVYNLEDPTRVETLYVPQQGFGMFDMIEGAPEYRDYVKHLPVRDTRPEGAEKIYISRSRLPPARGSLLGETRLEGLLEAEGYVTFYPERHSFEEQVSAYRAARAIVSMDTSPLHLVALVGDPGQKVACIARRAGDLDQYFARQLKAFQGIETTTISAIIRNWIPETDNRPSRVSFGEVDFSIVYERLKEAGFIHGTSPWVHFDETERSALLEQLAASQKVAFKPYVKK